MNALFLDFAPGTVVSMALITAQETTLHCQPGSLTDSYGLAVQAVLAALAFGSLVLKRFFCEPPLVRRSWTVWFFDCSKQAAGAAVIHFLNVALAQAFQGDPCTWYVVSFLLDSTLGLVIIYAGVRIVSCLASCKKWTTLKFGEYGKPPSCRCWFHQCLVFILIIVIEKVLITIMLQFNFWRRVREIILSPITNPKVELAVVMLIIPFFMNTFIFWVVDNFTMRKILQNGGVNGVTNKLRRDKNKRAYLTTRSDDENDMENGDNEQVERLLLIDNETPTNISEEILIPLHEEKVKQRLNSISLS